MIIWKICRQRILLSDKKQMHDNEKRIEARVHSKKNNYDDNNIMKLNVMINTNNKK